MTQHLIVPICSEIGDQRQTARKRNRSQQSRSRNSSKENKKSSPNKYGTDQNKFRSRSVSSPSTTTAATSLDSSVQLEGESGQPEYINIAALHASTFPSQQENSDNLEVGWTTGKIGQHTIGPDDWYRDDFDFDKSHPFLDDPMLLKQYAQILDMKYRDSSNEKIEELLIQHSMAHQADMERDWLERAGAGPRSGQEPASGQFSLASGAGRYPDSGYDTLPVDLSLTLAQPDSHQICVDIDTETKR